MNLSELDVKVYIERILKGPPSDDVWSVDATLWIDDNGEKKHERKVRVNVLKKDGYFEDNGQKLLKRLKDCYKRTIEEDDSVQGIGSQALQSEREKAQSMEGGTFTV